MTGIYLRYDSGSVATSRHGLTYPFGGGEPATGDVMPVAPGVDWVRLAVPGPLRHVNCYLLADADARGGGVALVDAGMNNPEGRATWKAVFAGPLAGTRVTRMIGTHMHPDHIGLAGWMCEYHDAPLLMTRAEWLTARMVILDAQAAVPDAVVAHWRGLGWDEAQIGHASARGWSGFRRIVTPMPFSYTRLRDGQTLRLGATDWRIVTGSGHSPEHACLLDEVNGTFLCGDQVLPRISPNVSIGANEPGADPLGDWFSSIAKLRALPAGLLCLPGHGDPFTGLHVRLDAMEAEHRERLDALHAFVAVAPRRVIDCFGTLFARPIGDDMRGMASGEALAHLRRLELEGRVTRATEQGVWWWRAD